MAAKLPKLWRKKRGDRFVGSWHVTIRQRDINLGTADAELANQRRRQAVDLGRRKFEDDLSAAARLEEGPAAAAELLPVEPAAAAPPPPPPPATPAPPAPVAPAPPAPAAAAPPAPPAPAAAPAPFFVAESPAEPPDVMAAAAAEVKGRDQAPANDNAAAAAASMFTPDALDGMLTVGAELLVDTQFQLQAALIKRRTGLVADPVPEGSPLRKAAAQAWVAQLKKWFPEDVLPAWAMALILPTLAIPQQLATAKPPTEKDAGASPAQAAA